MQQWWSIFLIVVVAIVEVVVEMTLHPHRDRSK